MLLMKLSATLDTHGVRECSERPNQPSRNGSYIEMTGLEVHASIDLMDSTLCACTDSPGCSYDVEDIVRAASSEYGSATLGCNVCLYRMRICAAVCDDKGVPTVSSAVAAVAAMSAVPAVSEPLSTQCRYHRDRSLSALTGRLSSRRPPAETATIYARRPCRSPSSGKSMPRLQRQPPCRYEERLSVMVHGLSPSGFIIFSLSAASLIAPSLDLR